MFRYRTIVQGRDAGESQIQVQSRARTDDFVFRNTVTGAFTQTWESVCSRSFRPISARLTMGSGPAARSAFEILYVDHRATGFVGAPGTSSGRRALNELVADDTVDQRIDWAAVMALPNDAPGPESVFRVYDPVGGNSKISVRVAGFETVATPAGSFSAVRLVYRIDKKHGAETYEVWAARRIPRFLVKERFPGGAVTELVKIGP